MDFNRNLSYIIINKNFVLSFMKDKKLKIRFIKQNGFKLIYKTYFIKNQIIFFQTFFIKS